MNPSDELLTRAVSDVVPRKLADEKLKSGKPMRIYLGIDPTGSKLHLGHSVPLRKLRAFQDAGHHIIFLIGSYTATIGDPTGRSDARDMLTPEQVEQNFQTYKAQAGKILDFSQIEIRYNSEWYNSMSSLDLLQISSHFTVQQMLQRDMFKERMKWKVVCIHCKQLSDSPIQFQSTEDKDAARIDAVDIVCSHCGKKTPCSKETIIPPPNPVSSVEILYPLLQGYDSVVLDVDCEIGGNDQLFNMLCGRKLQKAYGKRDKFVLTTKLIEGTDGRKMSKTYDNCIWIDDSAKDMFGKTMSIKDELIVPYMECLTDIPMAEIKEIEKKMAKGSNPKEFKMQLARAIVAFYHGEEAATHAEEEFNNVFKDKGVPSDLPEITVPEGSALIDVIVHHKLASSKSDARRLIEQGGVTQNDRVVPSIEATVEEGILRVGKRKFAKLRY